MINSKRRANHSIFTRIAQIVISPGETNQQTSVNGKIHPIQKLQRPLMNRDHRNPRLSKPDKMQKEGMHARTKQQ
jgi:hypothetical protein